MIERPIFLRRFINSFMRKLEMDSETSQEMPQAICGDHLSVTDWNTLEQLLKILEPFKLVTMRLEGRQPKVDAELFGRCFPQ